MNGIQEVSGSIPLISTIGKPTTTEYGLCGGIAQLGERLNGIQEVSGSIPLISTKNNDSHNQMCESLFYTTKVYQRTNT